jgi:transposase
VVEQRSRWHERLAAVPPARLVFVDESGANTKMTRLYGRAPVGERLVAQVPHGHYQTRTLIAAVRLRGPCAPWLFEGAMDGEMFLAWVRQGLVPTLQPEDWVILDNLATHKVAGVREAIEAAGARLLYLPPYSPDFNPIENLWSKVKQILRRLAPRTAEELLPATATADCRHRHRRLPGLLFTRPIRYMIIVNALFANPSGWADSSNSIIALRRAAILTSRAKFQPSF